MIYFNFLKKLLIILLLFNCFACAKSIAKIFVNRPDTEFDDDLKNASPDMKQGWKDGCEVGLSSGANQFYRMFNDNNAIDGYKFVNSLEYKNAWSNAYWYCYRTDYTKQASSLWGSMFSGYR